MSKYAMLHSGQNVDFVPDEVEGIYDIPVIAPEKYRETRFIPFNLAGNMCSRWKYGIHFFIDDYRFQRLWLARDKYADMLPEFNAVMSPDFSLYTDWPFMVQLYNHYRKHLLGAWMQSIGCRVYPSISWSDESSFAWCFDGEPVSATVCVSSVGTQKNKESKHMFLEGYDRMLEVLRPETILFYGKVPPECKGNIIHIEPFQDRLKGVAKDDYN